MIKSPRSRTFIMISASEIEEISDWCWDTILPEENDEFYDSFEYQVRYLQQRTLITIELLCQLLKISTRTYYILFPRFPNQIPEWSQNLPGRPRLVTDEDENQLLQCIETCQTTYNCIRP